MNTTLTLKKRVSLPPRALTRVALTRSAETLRQMQTATPAVIVQRDDAEVRRLQAEVSRLKTERDAAVKAAAERAHREERVKAITLRVFDGRAIWAAKMGLNQTTPVVALTSRRIHTAEVWEQPHAED